MDNVTHALAGVLLAEATVQLVARRSGAAPSPGFRRAALALGLVTAELPDVDIVYSGPIIDLNGLGYMLHHRGHTHTVLFALVAALLAWGATLLLRRGRASPAERWGLGALALAGTLSHVWLDWTNSYGVHPFWPVDGRWYYGDAVFIVEPWLWIAMLAPLLFLARGWLGRTLLGLLLGGILVAAWRFPQVEREVALALTIGAALWLVASRLAPPSRRVALGVAAFAVVEVVFFYGSGQARSRVLLTGDTSTFDTFADIVVTPAPGNPFCYDVLTVEADGTRYRVSTARVAPFPRVRTAASCPSSIRGGREAMAPASRAPTDMVHWEREWSAPQEELVALATTNCEVAAALRFIRVPVWRREPDGTIALTDLRYAGAGFTDVTTPARPAACPDGVPGWEPPRSDVLGEL